MLLAETLGFLCCQAPSARKQDTDDFTRTLSVRIDPEVELHEEDIDENGELEQLAETWMLMEYCDRWAKPTIMTLTLQIPSLSCCRRTFVHAEHIAPGGMGTLHFHRCSVLVLVHLCEAALCSLGCCSSLDSASQLAGQVS